MSKYGYEVVVRAVTWPRDIASVARSLARADSWFWLDGSATEPNGSAGLSYLGEAARVTRARSGGERQFLDSLRNGGSVGSVVVLGYEFGVALMGEPPAADDMPPGFALHPSVVLVLDHAREYAELRGASDEEIDAWTARHGASLRQPGKVSRQPRSDDAETADNAPLVLSWRRSERQYLEDVAACKRAIHEGDAYVLCLTDTATAQLHDAVDPLSIYLRLRVSGAAVRGAVISTPSRALVSASPERFLSKRGDQLTTHPIKGTRPRGATPEHDEALAHELAEDPKERAENLMIVDLMRNDLSRVCEPGTVYTDGFLRVEHHPRVHQLVSTVSGRLRDGLDAFDAIAACFPGGSMTGAPKRRAVQLLAELEAGPRGLYSGCFGWFDPFGDAEIAMTIRSVELRGQKGSPGLALVGAGGGVTSDSDPEAELAEKQLKAASLLAALGATSS